MTARRPPRRSRTSPRVPEQTIRFAIVGGGLMGREFAGAAARWPHLEPIGVRPVVAAVADPDPNVLAWYERLDPRPRLVADYADVLGEVDAAYVAVPHHLHEQ